MIELKLLSAPVDDIHATQPNVITFWESQNLGMGTLYLTAHTVTWMDESNRGFILTYPAIAVHAASGSSEQFPDPSLFLLVDVAKTASIRFVPEVSGCISHLYQTMNTCQELNPDPKDEMDSTDEEEEEETEDVYQPVNGGGGNHWYTAENIHEGVELNEEGLANLSRMLGNGQNQSNGHDEEAMDEDIYRQRSSGNQVAQCPCVRSPGSDKCISYDSRYQASSMEEAILTFVDTSMDPRIYDERLGSPISATTLTCSTEECRQCAALLIIRLKQLNLISRVPNFSFALPTLNQVRPDLCRRLRLARSIRIPPPMSPVPGYISQMIQVGLQRRAQVSPRPLSAFGLMIQDAIRRAREFRGRPFFDAGHVVGDSRMRNQQNQNRPRPRWPSNNRGPVQRPLLQRARNFFQRSGGFGGSVGVGGSGGPGLGLGGGNGFGRKKRAANDGILGDRFVISCTERGDAENDESDFINLCTACWTWRQLPPDYFPRLINELVCQENDYCLSGWGSCHQRYRNVDVLRKSGNSWQPTTISVATCCDCKVKAGTEVHSLVIGENKR
ncbi:hypothetical protein FO519_004886 [Halicephalobus sp. NKZ332]|nr:hypothetical protein FO519_004886 [Halicephalobus sp. NKZ332]